jgi:hypothetical protein
MNLLRHGGMGRLFTGIRARSMPGTFLRSFTLGHVRQLDSAAAALLANLAARTAPLLGAEQLAYLDLDDTARHPRAAGTLASSFHAKVNTATIRTQLIAVPARLTHAARKLRLHLPPRLARRTAWTEPFDATCGPPTAILNCPGQCEHRVAAYRSCSRPIPSHWEPPRKDGTSHKTARSRLLAGPAGQAGRGVQSRRTGAAVFADAFEAQRGA